MPRQSRGRQRIPIQRIENQDDMYATFSKRRVGMYRKACDFSTLCGVDIGLIIFSPKGKPYSFFSPTMESVIERYQYPNRQMHSYARGIDASTRGQIRELNQRLDEVGARNKDEDERAKILDEKDKVRERGWWEDIPVEEMNSDQLKEMKQWFELAGSQTTVHKQWLNFNEVDRQFINM